MSLNCFSGRASVEADTELEEASKQAERVYKRIQRSDNRRERVLRAIRDTHGDKTHEMESHLQWLLQQKMRLERDLDVVSKQLEEKKRGLEERVEA
ncbi:unnamed protein product [Hyaloperonospora brassicae]|uniref:Uncharacterized protein n=1 Tax=Hyaloperonospora brassicae TaxID=162125 RepID=A0AAV0UBY7_HYABA|nr:unnamed protein product [Hyaloperonospora brassicae]